MNDVTNHIEEPLNETLIVRYLSGTATASETEQLLQWIAVDKENLRRFRQLKNIWEASHPAFNPDEIDTEAAYRKVKGRLRFGRDARVYLTWFSRVAAVMFLPLLAYTLFALLHSSPSAGEVFQEIHAPYGTYSQAILPDGSKVSINAGSKLRFPSVFPKGRREVWLDGEGYFEVVSSPKEPFLVRTGKLTVVATGTKFNVEDYDKDSVAAVTMIEGLVNATLSNNSTVRMNPGDRILLSKITGRISKVQTDPYKWYAWKDGSLIFRDDPLEYVFKRLSQTFNVDIVIKDALLAAQPYRATFTHESLEEIMRLLKLSAPIQFKEGERQTADEGYLSKRVIEVYSAQKR